MKNDPRLSVLTAALIAALSAGCGSARRQPTVYLTLNPVSVAPLAHLRAPAPLMVGPVDLPPSIDRLALTTGAGGTSLEVSPTARWSGPLGDLIRVALARDLAAALPDARVLLPGDPAPPDGAFEVRVSLQEFRPDAAGRVTVDADWSLLAPKTGQIANQGRFHLDLPGPTDPPAEASTLSAALGRLTDAITRSCRDRGLLRG